MYITCINVQQSNQLTFTVNLSKNALQTHPYLSDECIFYIHILSPISFLQTVSYKYSNVCQEDMLIN